ncbi:hypothetical protein [Nonomuraea dietziae]|uniref:hypothetical protein n=1 Tax=Nonomuraea dietziae TaxID=65515 RepID=UPI0031DC0CCD
MDPRQRMHLMDLIKAMGTAGKTILFSSTHPGGGGARRQHIEVVVAGRHAASGDFREIRRLMTDRPHLFRIRSSDDRKLAAALIVDRSAGGAHLSASNVPGGPGDGSPPPFAWLLPRESTRPRGRPPAPGLAADERPGERLRPT